MKLSSILERFNLTPSRKNIIKNVYWAVIGKVVGILSGLLVGIFVARYLGPEQYGLMNYVFSFVAIFSVLATFGIDNIIIRELAKTGSNKEILLGTAFTLKLIFAGFTIILIVVTLFLFESDDLTFKMVLIYSFTILLGSFSVIRNYFTSIVFNEFIVKTEIIRILIGAGIKLYLLIYHYQLVWFIVASVFEVIIIASGYTYSYRKKVGSIKEWKFDLNIAKMLIMQSFPLLLSGTAIIIYQKLDQVMIRNMIDNAALGQYSVAARFIDLVIFIPTIIAQTVTPLLVQAYQRNIAEYQQKRQQFIDLMVWSSLLIALVFSLGANLLVTFLYGEQYLGAIPVLQIMAWQAVFVALSSSSGQLIIIENLQKYVFLRNLTGCAVSIIMNLILIPIYGIIGSAIATVVALAFSGYFTHVFIRPYQFLFLLQNKALFTGYKRIIKIIFVNQTGNYDNH